MSRPEADTLSRVLFIGAVLLGLGSPGAAVAGPPAKPRLALRATPRVGLPPVSVLVVAQLVGGEEGEDYYCPGLEWDWGDGSRSAREGDCEPFGPDSTLERRFAARHAYRAAGTFNVRLTLFRASRVVAVATVPVLVHGPSLGE